MRNRTGLNPDQMRVLILFGILDVLVIGIMGWAMVRSILDPQAFAPSPPTATRIPSATPSPAPTRTPHIVPTATQSHPTYDESVYMLEVADITRPMGDALEEISRLSNLAGESPAIINTQQWQLDAASALATLSVGADELLELDPPISLITCHNYLTKSANYYKDMVGNFAFGVDYNDSESIKQSSRDLGNASDAYQKFSDCVLDRVQ